MRAAQSHWDREVPPNLIRNRAGSLGQNRFSARFVVINCVPKPAASSIEKHKLSRKQLFAAVENWRPTGRLSFDEVGLIKGGCRVPGVFVNKQSSL